MSARSTSVSKLPLTTKERVLASSIAGQRIGGEREDAKNTRFLLKVRPGQSSCRASISSPSSLYHPPESTPSLAPHSPTFPSPLSLVRGPEAESITSSASDISSISSPKGRLAIASDEVVFVCNRPRASVCRSSRNQIGGSRAAF
ncbi:hypothetical protein VTN00DRAFT_10017 [Thermoascus crustaceus]|uniref:uncharacterized protein n=1 Tax=Thermoascus crustaceus TaxID=5088 RepID=UPI0037423BF3